MGHVFLKRGKRNSSPKNENVVIYIHHHVPNLKGVVDFKKKKLLLMIIYSPPSYPRCPGNYSF